MVELVYKGKGFIGYDKSDNRMIFIEKEGRYDYWVEYKGQKMLVRTTEVMPKGE